MRPRLLDDVRFVECQEGVYIQSGLASCVLEGRHVYRWISGLAPQLSGERTIEEITRGLPDAHREMVEGLVRTLAEQRFVVDARDDRPHGLSERTRAEYAPEIAFIRYAYDSPEWRFEQLRNARILLYGRGPVLASIVSEGLRSGWRRTHLLTGDPGLRETAEAARRDEDQRILVETVAPDPAADPVLRARVAEADLVIHVASGDEIEALITTARLCGRAGAALTQVLVRAADVWATPVYEREQALAESGWRWLAAAGEPTRRDTGVSWLTGPVPSLIAARVVLACFRHLAKMRPERPGSQPGAPLDGTMARTDLETLDTTAHRFHPHPATVTGDTGGGNAANGVRDAGSGNVTNAPSGTEDIAGGNAPNGIWVAESGSVAKAPSGIEGIGGGIVLNGVRDTGSRSDVNAPGETGDAGSGSAPSGLRDVGGGVGADAEATRGVIASLRVAERVSAAELLERARRYEDPYLGPLRSLNEEDLPQVPLALCRAAAGDPYGERAVEAVVGWGMDRQAARVRAVLGASVAYASLVAGHAAWRGGGEGAVWGKDLLTGFMIRVPMPAPGPAADPPPYQAPLGAAAGLCWDEAVAAGLLAYFEASPVLWRDRDAPRVDPLRESGGDEGVREIVRLLERTGEAFEFRDHCRVVGLPAYAVSDGRGVVARSVARTPAQALRHAAEHALLSVQARLEGRPEIIPPLRRWIASPADASSRVISETVPGAVPRESDAAPGTVPGIVADSAPGIAPGTVPDGVPGTVPGIVADPAPGIAPGTMPDGALGVAPDTAPDVALGTVPQAVWREPDAASDVDVLARRLGALTGRTPVAVPLVRDDVAGSLLPFVVQVVLWRD